MADAEIPPYVPPVDGPPPQPPIGRRPPIDVPPVVIRPPIDVPPVTIGPPGGRPPRPRASDSGETEGGGGETAPLPKVRGPFGILAALGVLLLVARRG